jgi:hypothetical protein
VVQDAALELSELRARVDPEPVGEMGPCVAVRLECVGLATRSVEGEHQEPGQALTGRLGSDFCLELANELACRCDFERRSEALLDRVAAEILEEPAVDPSFALDRAVRQDRSAPQG